MPVIRAPKERNFTVVSNVYLRDKTLSLKAKGMLTLMLSLPAGWDYSLRGLSAICLESKTAVSDTLRELERRGYILRYQPRKADGKLEKMLYIIHEKPVYNSVHNPVDNLVVHNLSTAKTAHRYPVS